MLNQTTISHLRRWWPDKQVSLQSACQTRAKTKKKGWERYIINKQTTKSKLKKIQTFQHNTYRWFADKNECDDLDYISFKTNGLN